MSAQQGGAQAGEEVGQDGLAGRAWRREVFSQSSLAVFWACLWCEQCPQAWWGEKHEGMGLAGPRGELHGTGHHKGACPCQAGGQGWAGQAHGAERDG